MLRFYLGWFSFLYCMVLTSCSSVVIIRSTPPECEVSMRDSRSNEDREIGKTPLEIDMDRLSEMVNSGPIVVKLTKRGYQQREYIIPNLYNTTLSIDAFLYPSISDYRQTNGLIAKLFESQRLIKKKQFDEAIKVTDDIVKTNPNIASAYEMYGTIYFLKKDYQKSYENWIKVIELEPGNVEAQKMVELIEKTNKKSAF